MLRSAVISASALTGQMRFKEAVQTIDAALIDSSPDEDEWLIAQIVGMAAASEAGLHADAKRFALAAATQAPDHPGVKRVLAG